MIDSSRYVGKPLRRLVELYALWAIGELRAADRANLESIASKLTELFGGDGTWQAAIASAAQLPTDAPLRLREMWKSLAQRIGEVDPQTFAEAFVDENVPL
jgi:hypothetical protein